MNGARLRQMPACRLFVSFKLNELFVRVIGDQRASYVVVSSDDKNALSRVLRLSRKGDKRIGGGAVDEGHHSEIDYED